MASSACIGRRSSSGSRKAAAVASKAAATHHLLGGFAVNFNLDVMVSRRGVIAVAKQPHVSRDGALRIDELAFAGLDVIQVLADSHSSGIVVIVVEECA